MLAFAEALKLVLEGASLAGRERVGLAAAAGRVLAEDLRARAPMPAFDYSAMDGYAFASRDAGALRLPVGPTSQAGAPAPELPPGHACRIYTGAPMPAGADSVLPQEDVTRAPRERDGVVVDEITFARAPTPGRFVRKRGADLADGALALAAGARLGPGQLALAAALDRPTLLVAKRPRVVVLCSGDELRDPGVPGGPASIPDCNGPFVAAAAERAGAAVTLAPFVRDDEREAERVIASELGACDLLVTVGGVSVGDRDVVRGALEAAGVEIRGHRVAIKPGKPLLFGRAGVAGSAGARVLGLPGNPASAALVFVLFGLPLLRALQGESRVLPPRAAMPLGGRIAREPGRLEFVRATIGPRGVVPLANQASGAPTSFAQATHLIVIEPDVTELAEGDLVDVVRLDDC